MVKENHIFNVDKFDVDSEGAKQFKSIYKGSTQVTKD